MSEFDHYHDPSGMRFAGTLRICSRSAGPGHLGVVADAVSSGDFKKAARYIIDHGHSWIEYEAKGREKVTWGTWMGEGVVRNRERHLEEMSGRRGAVTRSVDITPEQEKRLFEYIARAQSHGEKAWTEKDPCSSFTRSCWHWVTGEKLQDRGIAPGLLRSAYSAIMTRLDQGNPTSLSASIVEANRRSLEHDRSMER